MKKLLTFITITIVGLPFFTGCNKYEYSPSVAAKINGQQFNGTGKANVYAQVDTATHNPQVVIIKGQSDVYTPGTSFKPMVVLVAPHVEGTYTIDTNNTFRKTMVYTAATGAAGTVAVSGQINILSIKSGKIEGNFTLNCADGTTVTSGQYVCEESYY